MVLPWMTRHTIFVVHSILPPVNPSCSHACFTLLVKYVLRLNDPSLGCFAHPASRLQDTTGLSRFVRFSSAIYTHYQPAQLTGWSCDSLVTLLDLGSPIVSKHSFRNPSTAWTISENEMGL
jgi:hypothetical protein